MLSSLPPPPITIAKVKTNTHNCITKHTTHCKKEKKKGLTPFVFLGRKTKDSETRSECQNKSASKEWAFTNEVFVYYQCDRHMPAGMGGVKCITNKETLKLWQLFKLLLAKYSPSSPNETISTDYRSESSCTSSCNNRSVGRIRSVVEQLWRRKQRLSSWPLWVDGGGHGSPRRRLLSTRLPHRPNRHFPHLSSSTTAFFTHTPCCLIHLVQLRFPLFRLPHPDGAYCRLIQVMIHKQQHNNRSRC